jgi:tetratricopeptide (TPR) repeat protein
MAQGKTEQARNYLTKAIEDDSENVFAINLLGELLLQLQKTSDAIIQFAKAIEITPQFAPP